MGLDRTRDEVRMQGWRVSVAVGEGVGEGVGELAGELVD